MEIIMEDTESNDADHLVLCCIIMFRLALVTHSGPVYTMCSSD